MVDRLRFRARKQARRPQRTRHQLAKEEKCVVARAAASILYEPRLETFSRRAPRSNRRFHDARRKRRRTERRPFESQRPRSFAPACCRRRSSFLIASPNRSRGPIRKAGPLADRGFARSATVPRSSTGAAARSEPQAVAPTSSTSHEARTGLRRRAPDVRKFFTARPGKTHSVRLGRNRSTQAGRVRSPRSRNNSASARLATAKVSKHERSESPSKQRERTCHKGRPNYKDEVLQPTFSRRACPALGLR
jgi:hypothetical protein